ncbi:WD40 repeat-like protein [Macrolepiota fuliginosa MF-IS2]|uniref:WD40 repeat-like protein n=1 Tax=Macrolepiota fuliginosa MF-IS2 TaxID=1400762 RepID=A0A9P6C3V5_9AGAR|nr:WD40 repeat-like protein [Macrolepiota fuliginosa MF-IS2]
MASTPNPSGDCGFRTPLPTISRKRLRTYASVTNFKSQKRRKLSMTSMEFDKENEGPSTSALSQNDSPLDRFIPNRPKMNLPLQITPRTKRISKEFGLLDDRILNFKDENADFSNAQSSSSITTTNDIDTLRLLRKSASSLFTEAPPVKPTSVTENLLKKRQCLVVLDSPNIQPHIDAYPISWSKQNLIAVSCGRDVYYQNLNTKVVAHLCRSQVSRSPIWVIEWAGKKRETYLASGMEDGYLQIWDATRSVAENSNGTTPRSSGNLVQTYQIAEEARVTACAWAEDGDILAVGARDKKVSILDIRVEHVVGIVGSHKDRVLGMKWSVDGNFLASSDYGGNVYIWDKRAGKTLVEFGGVHSSRMVHKAPVKALAWCSWKPDLLATGSYSPEGKIRIWSTSTITSHSPEPVQTIPLNTAIYSLQWSPHCKELLSTHGASFTPIFSRPPFNRTNASPGSTPTITSTQVKAVLTPLVNSITVHDYPTGKRLMSLSNAHSSIVSHSCLGPDGENVFTISPAEETIKMWQVWGKRPKPAKEKSAFDRHLIR